MKILERLPPSTGKISLIAAALLALGALTWHWSPARQVDLHQRALLRAVENRDWEKFAHLLAADFRDRWGHRRQEVLQHLPSAFQDFIVCGVMAEGSPQLEIRGSEAGLSTHLRVVGTGGPIAQFVIGRTAELRQPFAFTWRRAGWMPWRWELTRVDHPELEVPESEGSLP